MNRQEQMDMLKQEYQQIEVPEEALTRLQAGIRKAKQEQSAKKPVRGRHLAQWGSRSGCIDSGGGAQYQSAGSCGHVRYPCAEASGGDCHLS